MKKTLLSIYNTISFKLLSILGYVTIFLLLYNEYTNDGYGAGVLLLLIMLFDIIAIPVLIIIGCIERKRKQIDNKVKNIVLMIFFYIGISICIFFTLLFILALMNVFI